MVQPRCAHRLIAEPLEHARIGGHSREELDRDRATERDLILLVTGRYRDADARGELELVARTRRRASAISELILHDVRRHHLRKARAFFAWISDEVGATATIILRSDTLETTAIPGHCRCTSTPDVTAIWLASSIIRGQHETAPEAPSGWPTRSRAVHVHLLGIESELLDTGRAGRRTLRLAQQDQCFAP